MAANISAFLVLLAISIATAIFVSRLFRKNLANVMDEVVGIPPATTFYLRVFLIGVVFTAISTALGKEFDLKPEAAFMEYVWKIANGLSSLFSDIFWFLVIYLVLMTALISLLRRKNVQ